MEAYEVQISAYEDRMAESTTRSLRHLEEAYQCGADAAKELEGQKEQLDRVEKNLDKIEATCEKSDRSVITNARHIWWLDDVTKMWR